MKQSESDYGFTPTEWETCLKVLTLLQDNPLHNPDNMRFKSLLTKIQKQAKKQLKQENLTLKREQDLEALKDSTIVKNALNNTTLFKKETIATPTYKQLNFPRNCYACNQPYNEVHSFYHKMCPKCAELNYRYRHAEIDLSGRNVILTGGRVKVGYASALKLLKSKANVLITTRFPALAEQQFSKEKDYDLWKDRLVIYGLDLRNLQAVNDFIDYYTTQYDSLDILINNAAQTIKYPDEYYAPLIQQEQNLLSNSSHNSRLITNSTPVAIGVKALEVPLQDLPNAVNRFGQPIDNRTKNSWNSTLEEISTYELLEVNLINQLSPYLLIKSLLPLLQKSAFEHKFIINVTSSEGQFSYDNKTVFHPHTNMTKAALNMLTRTSAPAYAKQKIWMNAVDVGWISTGVAENIRKRQFKRGYIPPLDSVDGAARILHPIYETIENTITFTGKLLKNYQIENW